MRSVQLSVYSDRAPQSKGHAMLIALACLALVLLLICLFLRTDVLRAVRAKEDWRAQAIEADKSCRLLGERGAKLMSVIRDNNLNYQQLSDQLEDAEQELQEAELELAFERASLAAVENTIGFWIQQFNQAVEDRRAERKWLLNSRSAVLKERNELTDTLAHARRGDAATLDDVIKELARRASQLEICMQSVGAALSVPEADRDIPGLLVEKAQEVVKERDDLKNRVGQLDVRTYALGKTLNMPGTEADWDKDGAIVLKVVEVIAARDEATALLVKSQEEAAELAKDRQALIEQSMLGNDELCTVLEAIREKAHLFAIGVGVRQYAARKRVALTVSSGMDAVASALDDMKSDLESRAERLRFAVNEREAFDAELRSLRAEIAAVAEAVCVSRGLFIPAPSMVTDGTVRGYVAGKGVALLNPDLDAVVLALDGFKSDLKSRSKRLRVLQDRCDNLAAAAIKPTRGPAEDIAPPVPRAKRRLSIVGRKQAKRSR